MSTVLLLLGSHNEIRRRATDLNDVFELLESRVNGECCKEDMQDLEAERKLKRQPEREHTRIR